MKTQRQIKGEEYEKKVQKVLEHFSQYDIRHDIKIRWKNSWRLRQIDNLLEVNLLGNKLIWEIECKNWNKKIWIPQLDAFSKKKDDVGANFWILVSKSWFTKSILEYAEKEWVWLFQLLEDQLEQKNWLKIAVWVSFAWCPNSKLNIEWFSQEGFKRIQCANKSVIWTDWTEYSREEFYAKVRDLNYDKFKESRIFPVLIEWVQVLYKNWFIKTNIKIDFDITMYYFFREIDLFWIIQYKKDWNVTTGKVSVNHNRDIFENEWERVETEEELAQLVSSSNQHSKIFINYNYWLETYL